ncbi:CehA/McbA family metallohydrolase, partial [Paenibacillus mendelii]
MEANELNLAHSHFFRVEEESDWLIFNVDCGSSLPAYRIFHVRDPLGRLRYQHLDISSPRTVTIHRDPFKTNFNGVGGAIPAGEWRIDFGSKPTTFKLHYEYGNGALSYKYRPSIPDPARDIWATEFDRSGRFMLNLYDWESSREEGSRWYKGDCHLHTMLSDGSLPPSELNRQAQTAGLDFIVATDHFIVPTSWPQADLLVIPGIEVTASCGHWNALGPRTWIDWNGNLADGGMTTEQGMNRVIRDASDSGAVCSINHPLDPSFEWTLHDTDLSRIDAVEIVNSPENRISKEANDQTLVLWNTMWNEGLRKTGIGGSDFHLNLAPHEGGKEYCVGSPTTCVFASRLSAHEILDGIRAGRVCVTIGPELEPTIQVDDTVYLPGTDLTEAIKASADGIVRCHLSISGMN